MASQAQISLQGKTRDEWRRACDTALRNANEKPDRRGIPIYQRRTPGAVTLRSTSEEELNVAARALAALWGTTKNPRGK